MITQFLQNALFQTIMASLGTQTYIWSMLGSLTIINYCIATLILTAWMHLLNTIVYKSILYVIMQCYFCTEMMWINTFLSVKLFKCDVIDEDWALNVVFHVIVAHSTVVDADICRHHFVYLILRVCTKTCWRL